MPERDIMGALDYLRALTEYIEALERVRNHARFLAESVIEGQPDEEGARILLYRIRAVDDVNPVMRCGS